MTHEIMSKILNVPYYSQIKDTQNPDWQDSSCGIAALKMVLDFFQPTNLTIDDLYQKGLDINGYLENVGWYHHSLALLAKDLGYKAITRTWNLPEEYDKKLKERGFSGADLQILKDEQEIEGIFTLKRELDQKHPIIVPVSKGFGKSGEGHLVVLIGYDESGFILNDPYDEIRVGKEFEISFEEFSETWSKRAIIIEPI